MTKIIISLHDQATELDYPAGLQEYIDLLFGPQAGDLANPPNHFISVKETGPGRFSVSGGAEQLTVDKLSTAELLDVLLEEVVRCLIYELDTATALHSASIAWRGQSILIPGPTGAGKTSLTGWFAANDFEFLSDELVLLSGGKTTLSFPRPLLAKPGADELMGLFTRGGRGKIVKTGANTVIGLDRASLSGNQQRQASLIIFPNFVAGSELQFASISPAMTGMKLLQCNLNARNLPDHGFRALSAFAREVPAVTLTYGSFQQLDGVADSFVKFVLESGVTVAGLQNVGAAFGGSRPVAPMEQVTPAKAAPPPNPIPEATPRKPPKKITIGMATYDDYDGVYFSLQAIRLYHPEILDDTEFLVIDNHPSGPCGQALKALENSVANYRYVPKGEASGTAIRNCVFEEAGGEIVLCMDCHVFVVPGALKRLIDYFDAHPGTRDLLQGPLINDDLKNIATHLKPEWRGGMYGIWSTASVGTDPDDMPFEITMQGLGLFACRRDAWPGFNPAFRGFGGEEGYIHEKFRQHGGRSLCLPFLRWMHRFNRPMGVPYVNRWEDRIRNYFIGFGELGWATAQVVTHFNAVLNEPAVKGIVGPIEEELALSAQAAAETPIDRTVSGRDPFASVWTEPTLAQQRRLLARITDIAEAQKLNLYLYRGTLLGHVREGGILPWDDNVDLAFFDLARDRYDAFRAAIEADGLQIFDRSGDGDIWIRICDPTSPIQSYDRPWTWPFVDIFLYSSKPGAADGGWPVSKVPAELVLPGRTINFEGVRLFEPEQPLAVLDLQYRQWRRLETSPPWNHRWERPIGECSSRAIVTDRHGRKIRSDPVAETADSGARENLLG